MFGRVMKCVAFFVNCAIFPLIVLALRLTNGSLIHNVWIGTANSGNVNSANTPNIITYSTDLAPYGFDMGNTTLIKFEVKSCGDAFVTLIADYDIPILYDFEIGIFSNQHTYLLLQNAPGSKRQIYTPGILDCNEFRPFWISWAVNGEIRFGKGLILFKEEVMHWVAGTSWDLSFVGIAIRSSWGSHGTWIIHNKANPIGMFCGHQNTFADMILLGTAVMRSVIECTMQCRENSDCLAINFHTYSHECRLISGNQLIVTSITENWVFMGNCLQGRNACIACM